MKNKKVRNLAVVFKNIFEQKEESSDDLFDEEEDSSSEDEPADDEPADDEPADEPESGNDEKEAPEEEVTPEDQERLKDSIDAEIESVLGDFEADARKSAEINSKKKENYQESLKRVYYKKLWESAAGDIDVQNFASNVARLVKNYSNLLDIETIILNKAYSYIEGLYGEDTVKQLKDVLEQEFDLEIKRNPVEKDLPDVPVAVGARNTSGGM